MTEASPKKPKRRSEGKKASPSTLVACMHEVNLALCLASGFFSPRLEPSAALDQHIKARAMVLTRNGVPDELIAAARGGLDYGAVAFIEFEEQSLKPTPEAGPGGEFLAKLPIPLGDARRVLFRADRELQEFKAKASSYGDVALNAVEIQVAADLAVKPHSAPLFRASEASPPPYGPSHASVWDKVGGILAASSHSECILAGSGSANALIRAMQIVGEDRTAESLLDRLAGLIDVGKASSDVAALARQAGQILCTAKPAAGLNPLAFLEEFEALAGANVGKATETFLRHAKDIVTSRREVSEDAFEDSSGKIVQRGLLLFLLNPDAERMGAIPRRVKKVGPRVYAMACAFLGCFAGLANLPTDWKAGTADRLHAIALATRAFFLGAEVAAEALERWDATGRRATQIRIEGKTFQSTSTAAPAALGEVVSFAAQAGMKAGFDAATGQLRVIAGEVEITAGIARSPITASPDVLRLSVNVALAARGRDSLLQIWSWLASARANGLVVEPELRGKVLAAVVSGYLAATPAKTDLQKVLDSLAQFARQKPLETQRQSKPKSPPEPVTP